MLQGRISLLILYVKPRTGNLNNLQVIWPHFEGQATGIDSRQSPPLKGRLRARGWGHIPKARKLILAHSKSKCTLSLDSCWMHCISQLSEKNFLCRKYFTCTVHAIQWALSPSGNSTPVFIGEPPLPVLSPCIDTSRGVESILSRDEQVTWA